MKGSKTKGGVRHCRKACKAGSKFQTAADAIAALLESDLPSDFLSHLQIEITAMVDDVQAHAAMDPEVARLLLPYVFAKLGGARA